METSGYLIICFRGGYYRFYNRFGSNPDDRGSNIVNGIPIDPEEYQKWLATQRAKASAWSFALDKFLHVKRPSAKETKDEVLDDQLPGSISEVSARALLH